MLGGAGPSFELKFLLDRAAAEKVLAWAKDRLDPDPHADPALGGAYEIHTLYLDTPALDVYHRSESFRRRKFRVRRYGIAEPVFLEQKTRTDDKVSKRRNRVEDSVLGTFWTPSCLPEPDWGWFRSRVLARRLVPKVRVSYLRTAWVGTSPEGALRLTLDDRLLAAREDAWSVASAAGGRTLIPGRQVLELKYQGSLPGPFKELMTRFVLTPQPLSKYRMAVDALGLAARGDPHA